MSFCKAFRWALALIVFAIQPAFADPMLADFDYPFEVKRFEFTSQKLPLSMAYLDVAPQGKRMAIRLFSSMARISAPRPGSRP